MSEACQGRTPSSRAASSTAIRADIAAAEAMMAKIREVYALYGFEAVETPFVEYTQALGKFLPDLDRPNEGVFSFQDEDEQWLSLRYDLTAPLARYVAENYERLPKPYRSYRAGWVFRNEKPGPGRFRQFMQFDADTVGSSSPAADAEMCMMAADCLEALGIPRGDYVVKVNNRKVLDGVMEAIGLGGPENAGRRLTVLRAIDKLDRLGPEGVRVLLGEGRRDESGDFTKGAGLERGRRSQRVLAYTDARARDQCGRRSHARARWRAPPSGEAGVAELAEIAALVAAAGYGEDRILIDPSVVRGLEYYTGPVFEAELTFEVKDETAGRSASARSAAAAAMMASSPASAPSPCRPPASPSAFRACSRRCRRSTAPSSRGASPARSSCWRWIATAWPTTRSSSKPCATPESPPSFISARAR